MNTFSLKNGMLIGTASAASQIEGGVLDHSWAEWHKMGRITDGSDPARANDHWTRWRDGAFDEDAITRYIEEVALLQSYGIAPLVTLHHFTNPMWFENMGAFEKRGKHPVLYSLCPKDGSCL